MRTESETKFVDCLEHGLTMAIDLGFVENDCWFGDVVDVFADVELTEVLKWRSASLRISHVQSTIEVFDLVN